MAGEHERFDELAVGHVLGGLDPVDAAQFRSHLVGCRVCRLRVAELRDLASDLAAAEREERAAARLKTAVARRESDDEEDDRGPAWRYPRSIIAAVVVAALLLAGLAFWNLHLRGQRTELLEVNAAQARTLEVLAEGRAVELDTVGGVTGSVTVDDHTAAVNLAGLPAQLATTERLVVWLVGTDSATAVEVLSTGAPEGRLALSVPYQPGDVLVVTRQPVGDGARPVGEHLVRAPLGD